MIQKRKAEYLLKKSFDKSRTLDSFCKYEENRFNQAQFNANFDGKDRLSTGHLLTSTQTDQKVQQIKIKYGLYPRKVFRHHERSASTVINGKQNEQVPARQPLTNQREKQLNILHNISQSQNKPQRSSHEPKYNNSCIENKQNFQTDMKVQRFIHKYQPNDLKQPNYNVTFNQSIFKSINIQENPLSQKKKTSTIQSNLRRKSEYNSNSSFLVQNNESSSPLLSLNPRIQNINRINLKIQSAIENITQYSAYSKDKQPLMNSIIVENTKRLDNDMIKTRGVQNKNSIRQERNYSTLKNDCFRDGNLFDRGDNKLRSSSVSKNCYSSHQQKKYSSALKPSLSQQVKLLSNEQNTDQKLNNQSQKQHNDICLNDFSFDTERQPQTSQKQYTMRKDTPLFQNKYNNIRIKQDKSEYFDQAKHHSYSLTKQPTLQNERLSSMIKLALSNISARKQTKESQNYPSWPDKMQSNQIKAILTVIKRQIELDQTLRKAKYWLKYHNDDFKETKLKRILFQRLSSSTAEINGCNQIQFFSSFQGKRILKSLQISDEQIDPFYTVRIQEFTLNQVVDSYLQAENSWKSSLDNEKLAELMISGKWIEHIDLERKGFATVTDLTRFVNFASQGTYKNNRDLILVFKRLTSLDDGNLSSNRIIQGRNKMPASWFKETKGNKLTQQNLKKLLA